MTSNRSIQWPSPQAIHTIVFDFDGVFTDNKVQVDQDGREAVACSRADGLGIDILRAMQGRGTLHAEIFILSKEINPVVKARARKLKLECVSSIDDKLGYLENHFSEKRPQDKHPMGGLIYLGNDLNDLPVMRRAGFSVAPADAHPRIQEIASVVLDCRGGEGFVRSFIETFLGVDRLSVDELEMLIRHG